MPLVLIAVPDAESQQDQDSLTIPILSGDASAATCLFSFLSADQKTRYYVCEASDVDVLRQQLGRADSTSDVVMEIGEIIPGTLPRDTLLKLFPDILYRYR